MIPKIDAIVHVHRHGIRTTVRFWNPNETYTEFCVCHKDFPLHVLNSCGRLDLYNKCVDFVRNDDHDTFSNFPYPAYLDIRLSIIDRGDHGEIDVEQAKYAETKRGIIDFTGAFRGKLITNEICLKVIENIFKRISNRNAEELVATIERLRSVSGGNFVKAS